jgi:hypothetical protein
MDMASKYWIKLYIEILDDLKMGMMSDYLWRRTVELFLAAGEYAEDGKLPKLKQLSWRLRIPEEELLTVLKELEEHKITMFDGEYWYIANFTKRQTSESLERVRRYRERQKEKQCNERYSNGEVTRNNGVNVLSTSTSLSLSSLNSDEVENEGEANRFRLLYDAFLEQTGINEMLITPHKAHESLERWVKAGVSVEQVKRAVEELQKKDFSIVGPWSIDNAINIIISREGGKARQKKQKKYREIMVDGELQYEEIDDDES